MIHTLLSVLPPMLLGAQLILTLIMVKGEICPGQRGRVHKVLPAVAVLWLAVASIHLDALLIAGAIIYFCSKVQTKKTRDEGPLTVMYGADILAFASVLWQSFQYGHWSAGVAHFVSLLVLGGIFAHLMMTIARSRLQAFNRLLPVGGILGAMLVALCIVPFAYHLEPIELSQLTHQVLTYFALLVIGIIIWCWHIVASKPVGKLQLVVAQIVLLISMFGFERLYQVV